jgi:hypothetical protein
MVEDKLSEAVLRSQFKVFEKVYALEMEMPEVSPALKEAFQSIDEVLGLEQAGSLLRLYCSKNIKMQLEKTVKDITGAEVGVKVHEYVSKAVIDVEGGEIVLKTDEPSLLPPHTEIKALMSPIK